MKGQKTTGQYTMLQRNNLTVVQILEAAIESNRTGKAIKL
jgi:hypothetical protein